MVVVLTMSGPSAIQSRSSLPVVIPFGPLSTTALLVKPAGFAGGIFTIPLLPAIQTLPSAPAVIPCAPRSPPMLC